MNKKRKIIISAVGLFLLVTSGVFALQGFYGGGDTIPEDTFTRGLVGYWSFDEGSGTIAYDASGNGNNGTLTNSPKWTQGRYGSALQFDGKNDYISVPHSDSMRPPATFSAIIWVKIDNFINSYHHMLDQWVNADPRDGFYLAYRGTEENGVPAESVRKVNFMAWNNNSGAGITSETALEAGKWYMIVAVASESQNRLEIYDENGLIEIKTGTGKTVSEESGKALTIGVGSTGGYGACDATIDEVRIYNRALTEAEVKYHYNHGGPVAYWSFDEGSGTTAHDLSGNGNDGTLTNGPTWTQGKYGSALSFDGTDDYVDTSFNSIGDVFTISGWINKGDAYVKNGAIFSNMWDGGKRGATFNLKTDNKLWFQIWFTDETVSYLNSEKTLADEYTYISAVYDGVKMKIYINGVLDNESENIEKDPQWTDAFNFRIGMRQANATYEEFNGLIDDVKIYDYARTADEIRLDYQAGMATHLGPSGKTCSEDPASCMDYGLVGYWDMDEGGGTTLADKSGNNNNGTLTNGPKWTKGRYGSALSFDGKDDYVTVDHNNSLNIGTGDFSGSIWFKTKAITNNPRLFAKYSPYQTWVETPTGLTRAFVYYSDATKISQTGTTVVNDGVWHCFVWTLDRDGYSRTYIDGKEDAIPVDISNFSDEDWSGSSPFEIGVRDVNIGEFDGQIDEVRIYNRVLSESEVKYHYNHGGPVGYWSFDEGSGTTAYDASGNGNNGTLTNGPTWVQGKYGSALSFDGTDDYVSIPNNDDLDITADESFSYGLWLKTTAEGCGSCHFLIKYSTDGYFLWLIDGVIRAGVNDSDEQIASSGYQINDGNWHYAEVVFDRSTDYMTFYVDGVVRGWNGIQTIGSLSNSNPLYLMRNSSSYINGQIDEVKIYDYARTADEIRLDYQAGLATHLGPSEKTCSEDPASCMDYGLVGYWPFDEGGGTTVFDATENGNNGTLTNGPKWAKGKNGGALQFDGKDDKVQVDDSPSLTLTPDFSAELWFNTDSISKTQRLLIKGPDDDRDFHLYLPGGNTLSGNIRDSSGNIRTISTTITEANRWYHCVFVAKGGEYLKLYLDGVEESVSCSYYPDDTSNPLLIGQYPTNHQPFVGSMDEVRIYNRALSAEEVRHHYNKGQPVAYWDMNEGEGSRVFDKSGNNNHGTISGATWIEGKHGSALSFDGTDYIDCGNKSTLDITDTISMAAWVKADATQVTQYPKIIAKSSAYLLHISQFEPYTITVNILSGGDIRQTFISSALNANEWTYITFSYDGTYGRMYKNGRLIKITNFGSTGTIDTNANALGIGAYPGYSTPFVGQIDDVKIYDYVRTAEQIQQDYQQGLATHLK